MNNAHKPGRAALSERASSDPEDLGTLHTHTRPVRYRWSLPDGTICRGSSEVLSHTRAGLAAAERRFWQLHTHVAPDLA